MNIAPTVGGGDLDARYSKYASALSCFHKFFHTVGIVVIRQGDGAKPERGSFLDNLFRAIAPVGIIGMGVQVNRHRIVPFGIGISV